jgi:hypothetical protein
VGLNNAGKTSLLEAVQLYASRTPQAELLGTVRGRTAYRPRYTTSKSGDITPEQINAAVEGVRSLFHGSFSGNVSHAIRLGSGNGETDRLLISLGWATPTLVDDPDLEIYLELDSPLVQIARDGARSVLTLGRLLRGFSVSAPGMRHRTAFVPAQGLDAAIANKMWDEAAAAGHAPDVEEALRTVLPELERIYLLGEPANIGRSVALQLSGTRRPVPLSSMGDGTNRVFGIALACVRAREGVLLADEIENGLHHTIQMDVWKAIFSLSERLDIQVFATTHSWDAVVGFQAAANQSSAEGLLYRLEREADGEIYAERYTEGEVAVAADQQVEVR